MVESCVSTKAWPDVLLKFGVAVNAVMVRLISRSCVVFTLLAEFRLVLFADTGFVLMEAVAGNVTEGTPGASAGGVTTKLMLGVAPLTMLLMLQVMVPV